MIYGVMRKYRNRGKIHIGVIKWSEAWEARVKEGECGEITHSELLWKEPHRS